MIDRTEYQRQYHLARREKQINSKEYIIRQCMSAVRKLRKEIGNYNCDRVLEVLAEQVNK
jgi:hypothetical protein